VPFRKRDELTSAEEERAALRAQRVELEELKRELAERVRAVQEREQELRDVIGQARQGVLPHGTPAGDSASALAAWAAELDRRERGLSEREQRLAEAAPTPPTPLPEPTPDDSSAAKLAEIEARIAVLREAEKAFLRTQQELADRSEAVAARERLLALRERELDAEEDAVLPRPALTDLDARLRRLEQQPVPTPELEQTQGFSGGLRKLQKEGTRRKET
jgi:chromosome segregation ATPase